MWNLHFLFTVFPLIQDKSFFRSTPSRTKELWNSLLSSKSCEGICYSTCALQITSKLEQPTRHIWRGIKTYWGSSFSPYIIKFSISAVRKPKIFCIICLLNTKYEVKHWALFNRIRQGPLEAIQTSLPPSPSPWPLSLFCYNDKTWSTGSSGQILSKKIKRQHDCNVSNLNSNFLPSSDYKCMKIQIAWQFSTNWSISTINS